MFTPRARTNAVLALLSAAAAWPAALCALSDALATPLQRALASSWCGAAPQLMLGHCAACWSGAAMFVLAAALVARAPGPSAARATKA